MNKSREKEFNNLVEKFKALYNAEVNKDFYFKHSWILTSELGSQTTALDYENFKFLHSTLILLLICLKKKNPDHYFFSSFKSSIKVSNDIFIYPEKKIDIFRNRIKEIEKERSSLRAKITKIKNPNQPIKEIEKGLTKIQDFFKQIRKIRLEERTLKKNIHAYENFIINFFKDNFPLLKDSLLYIQIMDFSNLGSI